MSEATATGQKVYKIDEAHSTVRFWVRHMMISKVHGELTDVTGTITTEEGHPEQTVVDVTINANSLTTGNPQRDTHLKAADFLDVENHPTITFKSTKVAKTGDSLYEVEGDLTIHNTSKPVSLKVEATPEVAGHFGGYVVGISATGEVNREDFGINWNQALETGGVLVGKEIHLQIDLELTRA